MLECGTEYVRPYKKTRAAGHERSQKASPNNRTETRRVCSQSTRAHTCGVLYTLTLGEPRGVGVGVGSADPTGVGVREVVGVSSGGRPGPVFTATGALTFDGGAVGGFVAFGSDISCL